MKEVSAIAIGDLLAGLIKLLAVVLMLVIVAIARSHIPGVWVMIKGIIDAMIGKMF